MPLKIHRRCARLGCLLIFRATGSTAHDYFLYYRRQYRDAIVRGRGFT